MAVRHVIHEPLREYAGKYKEVFRKNAAEAFEDLVRRSGVDIAANKQTCRRIKTLTRRQDHISASLGRVRFLNCICILFKNILIGTIL